MRIIVDDVVDTVDYICNIISSMKKDNTIIFDTSKSKDSVPLNSDEWMRVGDAIRLNENITHIELYPIMILHYIIC